MNKLISSAVLIVGLGMATAVSADRGGHEGGHGHGGEHGGGGREGGWHGHGGEHWDHGRHHGGGFRNDFGFYLGDPIYWGGPRYPRYYGDDYYLSPPPVIVQPDPPVYIEQPQSQAQAAPATWYYCTNPAGYYPYVPTCTQQWIPVDPRSVSPPQ